MNNLFGIGILLELRDRVSDRIRGVSQAMEQTETQAEQTVRAFNDLSDVLKDGSGFALTERETQRLGSLLDGTSRQAESFRRRMEYLSHTLGGEVTDSTKRAYATMEALRREVGLTSRQYGKYSIETLEARNRLNEFALSMNDTAFKQVYMRSQLGLTSTQLNQQANSIKLNARMTKLMGNQTEILTRRMRGLQEHGVKPEMLIPPSTPGAFEILNSAVDASSSKLYRLSAIHRNLGNRVEKVIKNYSAMKVAVRQANGDMVKHAMLMRQATSGMTSLGILTPIMLGGLTMFYGGLFKLAFNNNKQLQELAETVKGKVLKAMKPLLTLVGDVAEVMLKLVGRIADWITKFNEAHPVLAKIGSAIALLVPAFTMLMLPIALLPFGIQGLMVALNGLWTLIAPFVAGLASASGMAMGLAGAVAVLGVGLTQLWKKNEAFRNAVTNAWNTVKKVGENVFNSLTESVTKFMKGLTNAYKEGGLMGVVDYFDQAFKGMISKVTKNLPTLVENGVNAVTKFVEGIASKLPSIYEKGYEIIYSLVGAIMDNVYPFVNSALKIFEAWLNSFMTNTGLLLNLGMHIITTLVNGIMQVLPQLIDCALQFLQTLAQAFIDNMPIIMETAIMILDGLIKGITEALPMIVDAVVLLLEYLVTFLSENAPILIQGALYIIEALADGIIQALPLLLDCALQLVIALVDGIVENLPLIGESALRIIMTLLEAFVVHLPSLLMMGVQLITALVSGIVQTIGQVIASAVKIMASIVSTIVANLPRILALGVELIGKFVGGIFSAIGEVVGVVGQVLEKAKTTFTQGIESFVNIGKDIISGLARGITSGITAVTDAIGNVVNGAIKAGKKLLGINSPSRVFKEIGAWTSEGMAIGIDHNVPMVKHSVEDMTTKATDIAKDGVSRNNELMTRIGGNTTNTTNTSNNNNFNYNITVNAQNNEDPVSMAEKIYAEIKRLQQIDDAMRYQANPISIF